MTQKKKKGLLSAVFDNLSLWGSLIIHASLTAYLLSFCIFLLKGMREVEGYVAIINFLYHSSGIFIKQSRMRFNKANFWISKQVSGSQYFKGCLSFRHTIFNNNNASRKFTPCFTLEIYFSSFP